MMIQSFKVGGITYTAKEVVGLYDEDHALGKIDILTCEISIEPSMAIERKRQTLIHELTHAIMFEAGLDDGGGQDEELVNNLSLVLYQVLTDNDFSFLRDKEAVASDDDF